MDLEKLKHYFEHITPLTAHEWEEFAHPLRVVRKPAGELLLREGQVCNFVGFLNKGFVRVYEIVDGTELNRTFLMENFFATEYQSFISRQPSQEYIETVTEVEMVVIPHAHLQNMYDKYKSFERLGRLMSEFLYLRLRKKIERFQVKSPEERYVLMLREHPEYLESIPHYHLASYLGITPQSLSRIRKRLK